MFSGTPHDSIFFHGALKLILNVFSLELHTIFRFCEIMRGSANLEI